MEEQVTLILSITEKVNQKYPDALSCDCHSLLSSCSANPPIWRSVDAKNETMVVLF